MNDKRLLLPSDRLSVLEHVQLFCDIQNYPMEIYVDRQSCLVQQNDVYNYLLRGVPIAVDASLLLSLVQGREGDRVPEVSGELVVIDTYNCYMKQGEYWYPYRFHFEAEARAHNFFSKGGFAPDLEHPVRWNTLIRFLKTFYGHRRKFSIYHAFAPLENYYTYLKSLYMEFKSIPSNELESLRENRLVRFRVSDELIRRRVLSSRV
ncbi:MAG TPA: hypothetical protein PLY66_02575 [Acidobacteriota bacterium]|nr:hypothetical protein [Acidobacteriota bacterium]HOS99865.1 hypothetical protein [Acidobacteriota bacterium]HQF87889.1 hypothetical protein [Acidobacteriota bacterium]HQG93222.1 hypothetical protein [Acidobacteriota bacterium]